VELRLGLLGLGYQTRTATGELLDRRRVTQLAELRVSELFSVGGLGLELALRFDTDLGLTRAPEAGEVLALELRAAALSWRAPGLELAFGRQLWLDELGFLALDGLRAELALECGLSARLSAGLQVRERTWLGEGLLELDGVEGDETPVPTLGAGLGYRWREVAVGVDYRRAVLWTDGWPLWEERVSGHLSVRLLERSVGFDAAGVFDLAQDRWERAWAQAGWRLPWAPEAGLRLGAAGLMARPLFAGDSIFNFFSPEAFWEARASLGASPPALGLSLAAAYQRRLYASGGAVDGLGLDCRWLVAPLRLGVAFDFEDGAAGRRWLLMPSLAWRGLEERLELEARLLVMQGRDPLAEQLSALTLGGSAGVGWRLGEVPRLLLTLELNGNRVSPLQTRALVVLDLGLAVGQGGTRF